MSNYPNKIICITEESVEFLYAIGEEKRIVGVSAYVRRPVEAMSKPKVSAFVDGNIKKMVELDADLILGHSDVQATLAANLIREGQNVFIANHRNVGGILTYLELLGNIVGQPAKTNEVLLSLKKMIVLAKTFAESLSKKPRIYIEEWNDPMISGIEWFSEIVELCGGEVIFRKKSFEKKSADRIVTKDDFLSLKIDMIFGCWCGKKVDIQSIKNREWLAHTEAVNKNYIYELEPEIFLQPGIAPILTGIPIIIQLIENWNKTS